MDDMGRQGHRAWMQDAGALLLWPRSGRRGLVLLLLAVLMLGQWPGVGMAHSYNGFGTVAVYVLADPSAHRPCCCCPAEPASNHSASNHSECLAAQTPALLPEALDDGRGPAKGLHRLPALAFFGGRNPMPDPHPPQRPVIAAQALFGGLSRFA